MRTGIPSTARSFTQLALRSAAEHEDRGFIFMLDAFRTTGGVARADEFGCMLRHRNPDRLNLLARWIAAGEVVYLQWGGDYWLPLFQFDRSDLTPKPSVRRVMAQLGPVFDAWDIAMWFARANPWLHGAAPACKLEDHPLRVEQAARADRFAAAG